jgi:hypothetical protein
MARGKKSVDGEENEAPPENLRVIKEAVKEYGVYKSRRWSYGNSGNQFN